MIELNKIELNKVRLNSLFLNTLYAGQKRSAGGDGFPRLPGNVTRWSFKNLTNEQMSKSPRLEDADGKGRFLTFKNYLWGGMSGCNGYDYNFKGSSFALIGPSVGGQRFSDKIVIQKANISQANVVYRASVFKCRIRITGISKHVENRDIANFKIWGYNGHTEFSTEADGIYDIDLSAESGIFYFMVRATKGSVEEPLILSSPIIIELLPYYPGFIISDGVDDYAVSEKDLDFEDTYTVYTAFIPFQEDPARNMVLCGKNNTKDFYMNYSTLNSINFYSSSKAATVPLNNGFNLIICKRTTDKMIIKNLLTNVSIEIDANAVSENPGLYYLWRSLNNATYANAAIAGQVICNGHFTTDEEDTKVLNWYKKEYPWLFFNQAWTVTGKSNEDTNRNTIANITGNGNNLVLSNFGFAGNSGYGEYAENWSPWKINKVDSTKSNIYHNRMEITLPAIGDSSRTQCNFYSPLCDVGTIYDFSIKISGLTDNSTVFVKPGTNGGGTTIAQYNKDGVYHLNYTLTDEAIINESTQNRIYFFVQNFSNEEMNLIIEQIPVSHKGYLVTDGVDDQILSSPFRIDKIFTVVGEWELLADSYLTAGLIKTPSFFVYSAYQNNKGLNFYVNRSRTPTYFPFKSIKAFDSNGFLYDKDWNKYVDENREPEVVSTQSLVIAYNGKTHTSFAFKNIAIYGKTLSKEDCIKAYIYLQTLKAK